MQKNLLVIKLGGVLLESDYAMEQLCDFFSTYLSAPHSRDILIVHGGGRLVDQVMKKIGVQIEKIHGIRKTSSENIDLIVGILAGIANKKILSWFKRKKINFIGLCLSDGDSVLVEESIEKDLEHVGIPKIGNGVLMKKLISDGLVPVVSSIGITISGKLMNVNADLAAAALAKTLNADLILLSDVSAILDGKGQRICSIDSKQADFLINQGIITNGMVVKVKAALDAARVLGKSIEIASWQDISRLKILFSGKSIGTVVVNEKNNF